MKKTVGRILIAAFIVSFAALIYSNFSLRRQLVAALRDNAARQPGAAFKAGDLVPRFAARDRQNRPVTLGGTSPHPWVMVLVHPRCKFCGKVLKEVAAKPASNIAVVSIMPRQASAEVTSELPPSVPAYFIEGISKSPIGAHAHAVPQILRVNAWGQVSEVCRSLSDCTAPPQLAAATCATCSIETLAH